MRKNKNNKAKKLILIGLTLTGLFFFFCPVSYSCTACIRAQETSFSLEAGDLLFQEMNGSAFFEAVAKVTEGYQGAVLTHVGIFAYNEKNEPIVIEALLKGVSITALDDFLQRSLDRRKNPKVLVGRLKPEHKHLIEPAIDLALAFEGMPYNHLFDIDDKNSFYCSELVYVSFYDESQKEPLFELEPMTFIDPDTKEVFSVWEEYFADLEAEIPEGEPGINPGGISTAPVLEIIHQYGNITGLR